jgi:hypothetical protein
MPVSIDALGWSTKLTKFYLVKSSLNIKADHDTGQTMYHPRNTEWGNTVEYYDKIDTNQIKYIYIYRIIEKI